MSQWDDFSLSDLYAAMDTQRQARGISWAQATREISEHGGPASARAISSSTVTGIRSRRVAEGDGVLQMLRWLGRAPESFVPGRPEAHGFDARLPQIQPQKVLRFDTRKIHAALDAQRIGKGMTWAQVARETGFTASMLTHLAKGGRTGFPHVMRLTRWLGKPAAQFKRASDR